MCRSSPASLLLIQQRLYPLYEQSDCWVITVEFVVLHELVVEVGVELLCHSECCFQVWIISLIGKSPDRDFQGAVFSV